ncbi:MAG: M14 family metallopeptidase [Gemmatimonadales bacterium]|nr:M14 family metallopeptidase [Gemmatimonadales bacterium]
MRAFLAAALTVALAVPAQAQWRTHQALATSMQSLAQAHRGRAELVTLATSPGGRAVQALRIGAGANVATRPALLVLANAHGPHLVGSEVAAATAERLLAAYGRDAAVTALLDRTTIWFVPRLNPDAAEAAFGRPLWERVGNGLATDDDRDQRTDEDLPDDLNGDGVITVMRVADPNGEWLVDESQPLLMRRADASKGEVGRFRLLGIEGKDDDGDGRLNEDAAGGTDVNRNFPYNYPHHGLNAGFFSMSAPEARGLAEFLVAHDEIAAVYVLGPQENLLRPWENRPSMGIANEQGVRAPEGTSAGGQLNSIVRGDQATFADLARRFQKTTGLTKGPASAASTGDVLHSMYYIFGKWAVGSRAWWVPDAPRDTAARAGAAAADGNSEDRNALRWFESIGVSAYVPWTPVTVPGERGAVEVGGWKPAALLNPPAGAQLDSTLARQERFIRELAGMLPSVALRPAQVEAVGDGVWRIKVEVANNGALPTTTALGARMRNPRGVRVDLTGAGMTILSGTAVQVLGVLEGGGRSTTLEWTVAAPRGTTLQLTAGSPVSGSATQTISLR